MNRARLLAPVAAVLLIAATPVVSTADSKYTTGCVTSTSSALHASVTRIRYDSGGTAVYASATQSYKQVKSLAPDINWTFGYFESPGLQTRYSQPTQWGSPGNPLNSVNREVRTCWNGRDSAGVSHRAMCWAVVGR